MDSRSAPTPALTTVDHRPPPPSVVVVRGLLRLSPPRIAAKRRRPPPPPSASSGRRHRGSPPSAASSTNRRFLQTSAPTASSGRFLHPSPPPSRSSPPFAAAAAVSGIQDPPASGFHASQPLSSTPRRRESGVPAPPLLHTKAAERYTVPKSGSDSFVALGYRRIIFETEILLSYASVTRHQIECIYKKLDDEE